MTFHPIRRFAAPAAAAASLAAPVAAFAHGGDGLHVHDGLAALAAGFVHPLGGADHLVAMLAIGAWSALALPRAWLAPLAFVVALLGGALLARAGVAVPAVEPMIAASLVALGLLTASLRRIGVAAGIALAALFALFHGAAHGAELAGPGASLALAGMVAATALLHVIGIGIGRALQARPAWMARAAGAAVGAFGLVLLVPALAG